MKAVLPTRTREDVSVHNWPTRSDGRVHDVIGGQCDSRRAAACRHVAKPNAIGGRQRAAAADVDECDGRAHHDDAGRSAADDRLLLQSVVPVVSGQLVQRESASRSDAGTLSVRRDVVGGRGTRGRAGTESGLRGVLRPHRRTAPPRRTRRRTSHDRDIDSGQGIANWQGAYTGNVSRQIQTYFDASLPVLRRPGSQAAN